MMQTQKNDIIFNIIFELIEELFIFLSYMT
jgi:hypothetical protein